MSYAPSVIRSIQRVSGSLAVSSTGVKNITLGTTLTDVNKALVVQGMFGTNSESGPNTPSGRGLNGGPISGDFAVPNGWYVGSTTQASINVSSYTSANTLHYNFYVVEFY